MKFREELTFSIIFLSAILLVAECQGKKKTGGDQYSYSYEYNPDYGSPDYVDKPVEPKPVDPRIPCYACTYEVHDGESQGTANCNEPFNSFQVPEIMCNGSCSMSLRFLNKNRTEYLLIRDCRPVCKESVTETRFIRCCSTKLCNGFTSSIQQLKFSLYLTLLLVIIALVNFELLSYRN